MMVSSLPWRSCRSFAVIPRQRDEGGKERLLVDGFPGSLEQARYSETHIGHVSWRCSYIRLNLI